MIDGNSLGKILRIFFSLKALHLLQPTFKMRAQLFKATFYVLVGYFDYFSFPPENQNLNNCVVTKSISEISVYVTRLVSLSSCGVEGSRDGIQFHRQTLSAA